MLETVNASLSLLLVPDIIFCSLNILHDYAENEILLAYYDDDTVFDIVEFSEYPYTILNYEKSKHESEIVFNTALILIRNVNDLDMLFSKIVIYDNQRSKYIFGYMDTGEENLILTLCWQHLLWNVVIINSNYEISSYPHFELENCSRLVENVVYGNCSEISNNLFDYKPVMNYQNCTLPTVASKKLPPFVINASDPSNPGCEIKMLQEMAKRLNFTIDLIEHTAGDWGVRTIDGKYTQMYKYLADHEAELMMGMVIANETFVRYFDCSFVHMAADISFFVPAAIPIEPWKNMFCVFGPVLWYSILAAILSTIISWWMIAKTIPKPEGYDNFTYCCMNVLSVYLFVSIKQPQGGYMRNMFMIWTWFSLIANSIYQGLLYSYITNPVYEHQITTIEELVSSKLHYGGYHIARTAFKDDQSDVYRKLVNNWEYCSLSEDCMNRTAQQRDFATIKNVRLLGYYIPRYYTNKDGSPQVFALDPVCLYSFWMVMNKGAPLIDGINRMILDMQANGITRKYYDDANRFHIKEESVGDVPLSIIHTQAAFFILILGWLAGALIFVFEIMSNKNIKKSIKPLNLLQRFTKKKIMKK